MSGQQQPVTNPIKKCTNHIRGCRVILDDTYTKKKCADCLQKDRERDHQRRQAAKEVVATQENHKICTTCCQEYPLEYFQGLRTNEFTKTCKPCRDNNKKRDEKRDKEHRYELDRIASKKPERIAAKKAWEEKNYDKRAEYWRRARQRYIENDLEGYLRKNAENAKRWRSANPEKYRENLLKMKKSVTAQWGAYQRSATQKNILWELSFDEFENLVHTPCYYCGEFNPDKELNGVGRKNTIDSYNTENCFACCQMCIAITGITMDKTTFLKRVKHILCFQKIITEECVFNEAFQECKNVIYSDLEKRANNKQLEFAISKEAYDELVQQGCYICGKQTSRTHHNGIDRIDKTQGYTEENVAPCCANCTYMKKQYTFQEFIDKLRVIYSQHKETTF